METATQWDAIVIGGGFYGCMVAVALAKSEKRVLLLEKNDQLFSEASFVNQARVHNGYHYPRSVLTAQRSQQYFKRFAEEFPEAIDRSFTQHYAIAKQHSKVNARQFELFCHHIGAACEHANADVSALFDPLQIEAVYAVEEYAFNAAILAERCKADLASSGVTVRFGSEVTRVLQAPDGEAVRVVCASGEESIGGQVWNVAYAGILPLLKRSGLPSLPFRFEWAEITLIEMPATLQDIGITVMDGPFFSVMPFPSSKLHSFTHVRYTPHVQWSASADGIPPKPTESNAPFALADAIRYVPELSKAVVRESLYTVKTILEQNDQDDGRPTLYRKHHGLQNFHVVMGGKIDTVFDVTDELAV